MIIVIIYVDYYFFFLMDIINSLMNKKMGLKVKCMKNLPSESLPFGRKPGHFA